MDREEIIFWAILFCMFVAVLVLTLWLIFCE